MKKAPVLAPRSSETVSLPLPTAMQSDKLGEYIATSITGLFTTLEDLKPYIEELWVRFDDINIVEFYEERATRDKKLSREEWENRPQKSICGCRTKKEYCEKILHRTPRAVQYMLSGGNPVSKRQGADAPVVPEPDVEPEKEAEVDATIQGLAKSDESNPVFADALKDTLENPIVHKPLAPSQEKEPSESRFEKTRREWADVTNAGIQRITLTQTSISSGVETSIGRYDLHLIGASKPILDKLRALLSEPL